MSSAVVKPIIMLVFGPRLHRAKAGKAAGDPRSFAIRAISQTIHGANMSHSPAVDPLHIVAIAHEAGERIMEVYKTDFAVQHKEDASPLTEADLAANSVIKARLAELTPSIPVLSEESLVDWDTRKQWELFWCVDPLDGTKEFVNRTDEFTVNIALIENNQPILGVVHAPALGVTYYANRNAGAYKISRGQQPVRIEAKPVIAEGPITIVGSRSHQSEAMSDFVNRLTKERSAVNFVKAGSALKFCLVADGTADMYPRLAPTSEWDTAAGQIIVKESGKKVERFDTSDELVYNKEVLLNPWFICR